jgi:hypothetical protein
VSDYEIILIGASDVRLDGGEYLPDFSSVNLLLWQREKFKRRMVIEAGWCQSLQSLRARARDYLTGRIVIRRIEPDAESPADIQLENRHGSGTDFLNTRIREIVEHTHDTRFECEVNFAFIISQSDD